jgi:iron(III) transport system permease protein
MTTTETAAPGGRPALVLPRPLFARDRLIQYALALSTLVLVAAPILPIIYQSLIDRPLYEHDAALTVRNYVNMFTDAGIRTIIMHTAEFAVLSTLISVFLGLLTAVLVGRTDVPLRGFFGEMLVWPLYISHLVLTFGWIIMYGPSGYVTGLASQIFGADPWNLYTVPGLAIVAGFSLAPLTFFFCIGSVRLQDASLEEAARTTGAGPFRALFAISLPLMRPAIVFSTVQNFVIALELLSIPLILGGPVNLHFFTSFLYEKGFDAAETDFGLVAAGAVLLLLVVTLLLFVQGRLLRDAHRFVTLKGKASRARILKLGAFRWVAFAFLAFYLVFGVWSIVGGLVLRAFTSFLTPFVAPWELLTLDNVKFVFEYETYVRSIWNTILIALIGGAVGTVFIGLVALVINRSDFPFRKPLEFVALYPRAVPGILVGLGAFYAIALLPFMGGLRNTIWLLALIYIIRYLPTGYSAVAPMLLQIGREIDKSARTVGADWWTTSRAILAGIIKPALLACFALLFIQFLKEYTAAVFLYAPGSEVIGTTMLTFWIQGDTGPVAALAVLQILITFVFVIAVRRLLGVKIYG